MGHSVIVVSVWEVQTKLFRKILQIRFLRKQWATLFKQFGPVYLHRRCSSMSSATSPLCSTGLIPGKSVATNFAYRRRRPSTAPPRAHRGRSFGSSKCKAMSEDMAIFLVVPFVTLGRCFLHLPKFLFPFFAEMESFREDLPPSRKQKSILWNLPFFGGK